MSQPLEDSEVEAVEYLQYNSSMGEDKRRRFERGPPRNSWEMGSDGGNGGKVDINPTWHNSLVGIRKEWIFLDNRKVKSCGNHV
jgi:hypothetical protein